MHAAAAPPAAGAAPAARSLAAAPVAGAAPVRSPAPPPARPAFAEVIREAKRLPGLFTVWQKDEKVWIEIAPAQFDRPFLLAATRVSGLGERGLYPHWMLGRHVVAWRRVHGSVQLIARATRFGSSADPGLARAAGLSFSDSLLGSAPVASAEHPERGSVLSSAPFSVQTPRARPQRSRPWMRHSTPRSPTSRGS